MARTAAPLPAPEAGPVTQWAKNIRSLAGQRGLRDQDVARAIGMSASRFSSRMSGDTRWLATEIRQIAVLFGVNSDVVTAESEAEFRSFLAVDLPNRGFGWLLPLAA